MEFRVQWFRRIAALSATAFAFSVVTATEGVARAADPASADVAVPGAVADVATSSPSSAASGSPAPGSASEAPQASPAPPVAQSENKPEPIGGVLGDFGDGERSALLKKGLSLQSTFLTEAAGNITGGRPIGGNAVVRGTANAGQFNFGFDEDFSKLFNSSAAGTLHFLLTSRIGSRIATTGVGSLISEQEIYGGGQTTRVTYLDYEQFLLDKKLSIRVGKQNEEDEFAVGSTYWGGVNLYCSFQNNNFCGSPASFLYNNPGIPGSGRGSEGYIYYPGSEYAVRLKVSPTPDLYIQASAYQENPIVLSPSGGGYFGFKGGVGTEYPAEIGYTLRNRANEQVGNVRVGGFFDTSNVPDYRNDLAGTILPSPNNNNASIQAGLALVPTNQYTRGRSGGDVQVDHVLISKTGPHQGGLVFFGAFEYSDPNTSQISTEVSGGLVQHGTFHGRPDDTIGLAFGNENFNPRLQRLETSLEAAGYAIPYTSSEQAIELNYTIQAGQGVVFRPNIQYVLNPYGQETRAIPGFTPARDSIVLGITGVISL